MAFLLHQLISDAARKHPNRFALTKGEQQLSYLELHDRVCRVSRGLSNLNLPVGARIGTYLPKTLEAVVTLFAASHAGLVLVPINPLLKPHQVGWILRDAGISALVSQHQRLNALGEVCEDCPELMHLISVDDPDQDWIAFDHLERQPPAIPKQQIDTDLAALFYTSGSTGRPKGVMLSHRNMVVGAASVAEYLHNTADDRLLATLPLSFDYGFSQLTTAFLVGAEVVLLDYLLPSDVLKAAAEYRITGIAGVPLLWNRLAQLAWPTDAISHLRYLSNSGGALPTSTLRALRRELPRSQIYLMYGLTEAFRSTYLPPAELDRRPDSIGKAIPNADIMVVRRDGSPCAPEEPGELVHRGALVSMGYWNNPEETARRFRPAPGRPKEHPLLELTVWSGDQVRMDAEGYLYFVSRKDEQIKTSGYRVSPTEVEEVLYSSGMVAEAFVTGIPDVDLGQIIVAVVKPLDPACKAERVQHWCRQHLPQFMQPRRLDIRHQMPQTPNGKLDRSRLRQELVAE